MSCTAYKFGISSSVLKKIGYSYFYCSGLVPDASFISLSEMDFENVITFARQSAFWRILKVPFNLCPNPYPHLHCMLGKFAELLNLDPDPNVKIAY